MTGGCTFFLGELFGRISGTLKDKFFIILPDDLVQRLTYLLIQQALHPYSEEQPFLALKYLTANQAHWKAKTPVGKS